MSCTAATQATFAQALRCWYICVVLVIRGSPSLTHWPMQGNGLFKAGNLPQLPSNAQYVYHENKCYDWGTFGWALSSGKVDPSKYKHIIFMNSSIRGPFLPPYWPVRPALAAQSLGRLKSCRSSLRACSLP